MRDAHMRADIALYADGRPLHPAATVAESGLRDGSVLGLGAPAGPPPEQTGLLEIRVAGGPAAGMFVRLGAGSGDIGRDPGCWVPVPDPALPPAAVTVSVDIQARCRIAPAGGTPVRLDGDEVTEPVAWEPGRLLHIGDSVLELAEYTRPDAALAPSADGTGLDYNRPPRIRAPRRQTRFRLPTPPKEPPRNPLPWLIALVPLIGALTLMLLTGNKTMLLLAFLSPISLVANHFWTRRQGKRTFGDLRREYVETKDRIERDAREALEVEKADRRTAAPDPGLIAVIATGPRRRLWERRRRDTDHLLIRAGAGDQPAEVALDDPEQDDHRRTVHWSIPDVPVTMPLREHGVIGFAGPGDTARALGRWAVVQTAVLHSPADVQITVLTDAAGKDSWDWVRWLPHARPNGPSAPAVLIGLDAESVGRRVASLLELIEARLGVRKETGEAGFREPDMLVVLDGSRRLRSLPGVIQLLREGPAVGVYAICLDADERLLPAECQAVAVVEGATLRISRTGAEELFGVRPDFVSPAWCAAVARPLAPIRDVSDDEEDAALPGSSRLLDVLSLDPPLPEDIVARWAFRGATTSAVVGESFDGAFEIDLRRDGPHGLIAGTTGSGKSELLQTIVASLAVANRPDAMTFVLVDYKGGSAFGDCVRLPHTVGMVTDLDEHLVRRALESLAAELRRREHILAAAGAKDIEDYTRVGGVLPRLLIVIDEFASMARELPDFVTGLVNVAQRGRSLGIHLLLATQRPSGVVSPEIRANTNLRIALRVTDAAESQDVLNAPDAARIAKSTPGRAYVRLGHASLVPFQAGRVGGRRPGTAANAVAPPEMRVLDWADLARPVETTPAARNAAAQDEITDLQVLVEALRGAAQMAGVPEQHSPWLAPLPDSVLLETLTAEPGAVPYGVEDLPKQQEQRTAALRLETFGHLIVAGAPRTGRSQLLRTMAGALARTHSAADVHLYGLDCGNGALLPLAHLPHTGAVVQRTEVERAVRLIGRLGEEIRRRQAVLAASGFADVTEQRRATAPGDRLSHIVLLLDRWEGFLTSLGELDAGTLADQIFTFLREGASVGVHVVITGDRSVLSGRIATLTEDKLAFRLADRGDLAMIGLHPRNLPEDTAPGRAFRAETGIEVQVALLTADPSGAAQAAALTEIGRRAAERDADVPQSRRAFRLGEVPNQIGYDQAARLPRAGVAAGTGAGAGAGSGTGNGAGDGWVLAGVGGEELAAYGPDLASGVPSFAVGGPAKSGRSTMLVAMARSALDSGQQVIALAPRTSPVRALAGRPGVIAVFTGSEVTSEELTAALAQVTGRALLVVDDASALRDAAASAELRDVIRNGEARRLALVYAGDPEDLSVGFSGWLVDARRSRRGALLSPQSRTDGDLVGLRLQRTSVGQPVRPGRALLHLGDGEPITVQVPE
ncbi:S-DNA-T family DNA segregation ATPase FtsK/SpoIIIE [Catenuloplanes nepalensis]|uniref:S-DNA-T family DNA segregation ATPase FtsK/SpoIIIE n=1 Tax=Catenuloplanes nepalensis TaxID=587533 RepID=A0ABT9MZL0_9ACTN|nr:FtsK/SpoIIIE domain-containing protein [Catenuloplanes nepalensis]MDP9796883.1 S-DNA-T family DNA segregation ATPase FtsK/SpoIIIE [Catenuloplanes nepalensis]